jgi:hypothetical protein
MKDKRHVIERWWQHYSPELDRITDYELLVLKIQIAVEDALRNLLAMRLGAQDEYIVDLDLTFSRLLRLALPSAKDQLLQQAFLALNRARNQVAHHVQNPKFMRSINEFLSLMSKTATHKIDHTQKDRQQLLRDTGYAAIGEVLYRAAKYWKE